MGSETWAMAEEKKRWSKNKPPVTIDQNVAPFSKDKQVIPSTKAKYLCISVAY